jgi:porin
MPPGKTGRRQTRLSGTIGGCAILLSLAAALMGTARAQVIYNDELVDGLPGPEALYDADQGQPQSLLPEPRNVLFPSLGLPFEAERLAFRQHLYDQYGLTYALSYQQLTQYATQTAPGVQQDWAVGGWSAAGITWTPLDRGGDYQGSLVVRGGWRGPIGNNPWPAPFGPANLGLAWSTYEFTSWKSRIEIEDLFWEQHIGPDFSFRIGNQGPQTTINTFRFKDARTSFTASPLAFSETIPYPAFGAGLSFRWRPIEGSGLYVNGVLNDMNGNPSQGSLNWSHLQIDQLFAGVEAGEQWRRANGEYDQLALLVFHAGTRSILAPTTTPNEAGGGFKVLGEKQWGPVVGFANYTYNTARGGGISTTFSGNTAVAGAAFVRPFGILGEVALAGMWSQPFRDIFPGSGQRDQWGIETYWNLAMTPNMTLTPDIQLIFDPSFNPRANFVAVPGLKFRISI